MEFTVEAAGPCRKRVKVHIPPERVREEFEKSYRQWVRSVPLPGFRPGKAPRALIEKRFGAQVAQDVKQALLDGAFEEALKEESLAPISDPEVDVEAIEVHPAEAVDFDFTLTVKPEFELPDLKAIEVEVPPAEPTDDEVDRALLDLRKRKATLRPLEDGAVEEDDVVSLAVVARVGGQEVIREDNLPYEVGSKYLGGLVVEGLDEKLVGASPGAKAEARASAPPHAEDHPLQGVEADVEVEVLEIKRPELPEVDDEFAQAWDFDGRDELLSAVRDDVQRHKERERDRLIENLALHQLVQQADFELPREMIDREVDELARRTAYELQQQGESDEEIAKRVAEVKSRRAEESERELKAFFLLDKIVESERLLVTENEVREAVALIAAHGGKSPEEMYGMLRDSGRLPSLRNQLREKKARERLRKKVQVRDTAPAGAEDTSK